MLVRNSDVIYHQGELAEEIYFISKGKVKLLKEDERIPVMMLSKGNTFGDIEPLRKIPRKHTA